MKRETLRHPKTLDLAARLGLDRPAALGTLMLLWDFAAEYAIQGDIGKWPNAVISSACDYRADPDSFVEALIHAKWLDINTTHRLIVHDWPDHCERWVKLKMGKLRIQFLECYGSIGGATDDSVDGSIEATLSRDQTEPIQTLEIPAGRLGGRAAIVEPITVDSELWNDALPTMQRIASIVEPGRTLKAKDRELCAKAAVIALKRFGNEWLDDVLKDIKDRSEPPDKPWGYFKGALAGSAARAGRDFHAMLRKAHIPDELLQLKAKA